jgi:cytosine/adenosine deaminase-related metal-dependent hydrolase
LTSLEIFNLGGIVSGRLGEALRPVTTLRCSEDVIVSLADDGPSETADQTIDANGAVAVPGLIDSHAHVVFGDLTPRQNAIGWIEKLTPRRRDRDDVGVRGPPSWPPEGSGRRQSTRACLPAGV